MEDVSPEAREQFKRARAQRVKIQTFINESEMRAQIVTISPWRWRLRIWRLQVGWFKKPWTRKR